MQTKRKSSRVLLRMTRGHACLFPRRCYEHRKTKGLRRLACAPSFVRRQIPIQQQDGRRNTPAPARFQGHPCREADYPRAEPGNGKDAPLPTDSATAWMENGVEAPGRNRNRILATMLDAGQHRTTPEKQVLLRNRHRASIRDDALRDSCSHAFIKSDCSRKNRRKRGQGGG